MPFEDNPERAVTTGPPPVTFTPVHAVFRAVVCTIVPEASALDEEGWTKLEALIDSVLRKQSHSIERRLRLFLYFIQWLPLFRFGRPFASLDPAQRTRFLSYLEDHPIRLIRLGFWGLRTLVLLGYYGRPEAAQAIGYAADPRGWEALR